MEWISVKKQMPQNNGTVIAYRNKTRQIIFAFYNGSCWFGQGGIIAKSAISHWMPIPETPKE